MSLFPFFLQISCLFSFHEAERFKFDWNLSLGVPIQAVKGTHEKTVCMNVERYHTSCTYDLPISLCGDETKLVHFLTYPKVLFLKKVPRPWGKPGILLVFRLFSLTKAAP